MKFLIYSFDYDWRIGGIVVLNKLANLLAQLGHETYIMAGNPSKIGHAVNIDLEAALEKAQDPETIVIYPEVIKGNPLDAKKVCRWVLYFPGFHGGETEFQENEFVFVYNKSFVSETPYKSSLEIKIVETSNTQFYNMGMHRNKSVILIKKGKSNIDERTRLFLDPFRDILHNLESADELIMNCQDINDYNLELNQVKYFISFDNYTYHNVLASLSGCISVVIPELGKTKEQFISEYPERQFSVFYGFDSIPTSISNDLLRKQLEVLEKNNLLLVTDLIREIQKHFKKVNI